MNKFSNESKSLFDQLQLRQGQLESSQLHTETLQSRNTELEFQLRESEERNALVIDELQELRSEQEAHLQGPSPSVGEISQLVNAVETKYEAKLTDLRKTLGNVEKESNESEANWSRKLLEKTKEADELRRLLQTTARSREQEEDVTGSLRAVIEKLKGEAQLQQSHLSELQSLVERMKVNEVSPLLKYFQTHGAIWLLSRPYKTVCQRLRRMQKSISVSSKTAKQGKHSYILITRYDCSVWAFGY